MATIEDSNEGQLPTSADALTSACGTDATRKRAGVILAVGLLLAFFVFTATTSLRTNVKAGSTSDSVEPGIVHIHDAKETPSGEPWSIHVLKIDRSRKDLIFCTPIARRQILGVSRISEIAAEIPASVGKAVAAINGDFYERDNPTYAGDPRGLQIVDGELVSTPSTVSAWFDQDNQPHIAEVKGGVVVSWPDQTKSTAGLNQQRRPNMMVLYTPTYGPSTRISGGRNL